MRQLSAPHRSNFTCRYRVRAGPIRENGLSMRICEIEPFRQRESDNGYTDDPCPFGGFVASERFFSDVMNGAADAPDEEVRILAAVGKGYPRVTS